MPPPAAREGGGGCRSSSCLPLPLKLTCPRRAAAGRAAAGGARSRARPRAGRHWRPRGARARPPSGPASRRPAPSVAPAFCACGECVLRARSGVLTLSLSLCVGSLETGNGRVETERGEWNSSTRILGEPCGPSLLFVPLPPLLFPPPLSLLLHQKPRKKVKPRAPRGQKESSINARARAHTQTAPHHTLSSIRAIRLTPARAGGDTTRTTSSVVFRGGATTTTARTNALNRNHARARGKARASTV